MLRNNIENYKLLITFAIYQQIPDFQHILNTPEIAVFEYCPGH